MSMYPLAVYRIRVFWAQVVWGSLCGTLEGLLEAIEFGDKPSPKSISPTPQRIKDHISRRRCRIVTRKGAGIYEFHGESEFEIEGVWFFDFLLKKSGSKCVKQRK